jgi:hypothetical protein
MNEVRQEPMAVLGLANGYGIEILEIDQGMETRVTWKYSNETRERTSKVDETGAFRTGRVWRRFTDFERVR